MLAAERYKSVWNMFRQALNQDPTACLRAFQWEQHVNKRSMARWMRNNGLSVRKAKTLLHESKKSADKQMPPSVSVSTSIADTLTIRGQQYVTYGGTFICHSWGTFTCHLLGYAYMSLFERQGVRLPILLEIF